MRIFTTALGVEESLLTSTISQGRLLKLGGYLSLDHFRTCFMAGAYLAMNSFAQTQKGEKNKGRTNKTQVLVWDLDIFEELW